MTVYYCSVLALPPLSNSLLTGCTQIHSSCKENVLTTYGVWTSTSKNQVPEGFRSEDRVFFHPSDSTLFILLFLFNCQKLSYGIQKCERILSLSISIYICIDARWKLFKRFVECIANRRTACWLLREHNLLLYVHVASLNDFVFTYVQFIVSNYSFLIWVLDVLWSKIFSELFFL